jgi:uncharacterized membrane protein
MAERNWRYLLFLLISHHPKQKLDHTIHLTKNVCLCTRCTGVALAMATVLACALLGFTLGSPLIFVLIGVLPVFAVADWFTQSAHLRASNTGLRLLTGYLLGISEGLALLLLFSGQWLAFLASAGLAGIYAASMYAVASKTGCLHAYLVELNTFVPEE